AKMESSKVKLVVPQDLKILLEGASRAVLQNNPDDIAEFIALYFQELIVLRTENPDLDINELINKFEFVSEDTNEELEEKISEHIETLFSGKPEKREKCTDTEEDQLLEEPDIQYSSQQTQYPSVASSIAETISPTGDDEASAPEGPELAYVPADPAQLAAHVLGNSDSLYSVRDVATSAQTLQDFQTSGDELRPVEGAAEDASAVPAAEASVETIRSQA
ncbi:CABYR protein, partial [Syrrhaptes paradoxus]|nr:CABYR protein [Syrrhaptes paradoxus]